MGLRYPSDMFCPMCSGKQYIFVKRKTDMKPVAVTCRRCRENLIRKWKRMGQYS